MRLRPACHGTAHIIAPYRGSFWPCRGCGLVPTITATAESGELARLSLSIITTWALTPPFTWLLGFVLDLGALGGWLALCGEIIMGAVLFWWRLERCGWQSAAVLSRTELVAVELEHAPHPAPALSPAP